MAAARLREEQDSKRRKHFEDLGRKDDERRRQAEERRRMLDEERRLALQNKWETKRSAQMSNSFMGGKSKPSYAFGSCTPRLLDNHVDGFLWKSQYNLNVTKEPGMRASSAQDLHLQSEFQLIPPHRKEETFPDQNHYNSFNFLESLGSLPYLKPNFLSHTPPVLYKIAIKKESEEKRTIF